jgi:ATP-binding cassette subfamily F protein 3
LLDAVGTRTVAFEDRALRSYVGGWPEYVRVREQRAREAAAKPKRPARAPAPRRQRSARPDRSQAELEQQIEAAEAALRTIEDELADPSAWSGPEASARSTARHDEAKRSIEALYARLEQIAG